MGWLEGRESGCEGFGYECVRGRLEGLLCVCLKAMMDVAVLRLAMH